MNKDIEALLTKIIESPDKIWVNLDKDRARFQDWKYTDYDNDLERDIREVKEVLTRITNVFRQSVAYWSVFLGPPVQLFEEYEHSDEYPCWASGGLFARWNVGTFIYTIFLSADNPEDPYFLVAAKAPLNEYKVVLDDYNNPWDNEWFMDDESLW